MTRTLSTDFGLETLLLTLNMYLPTRSCTQDKNVRINRFHVWNNLIGYPEAKHYNIDTRLYTGISPHKNDWRCHSYNVNLLRFSGKTINNQNLTEYPLRINNELIKINSPPSPASKNQDIVLTVCLTCQSSS